MSERLSKTIRRVRGRIKALEAKGGMNSQAGIRELKPVLESLIKVREEVSKIERERHSVANALQDAATYIIKVRDAVR